MVEKLLRQYGVDLLLGARPGRGLFQSGVGKLDRLAKLEPGVLGLESRKRYVYIGPLDPEPREDMVLLVQGKAYVIRAAHRIMGPDGPLYSWAMCVEKGSGNGL